MLQWSRNPKVAETHPGRPYWRGDLGFNGAATLRSRKPSAKLATAAVETELQWSRNPKVAETRGP